MPVKVEMPRLISHEVAPVTRITLPDGEYGDRIIIQSKGVYEISGSAYKEPIRMYDGDCMTMVRINDEWHNLSLSLGAESARQRKEYRNPPTTTDFIKENS